MKKIYPLLSLLPVFISCSTRINYLGSTAPPTQQVDVYVDASAIKKPYTIIGKGYHGPYLYISGKEKLQRNVIRKAKEKGADAILFQEYFLTNPETRSFEIIKPDSVGNAITTSKNVGSSAVISSQINILFLKYK